MRFKFSVSSFQLVGAVLALVALPCLAADLPSLCADRAAIERVYHEHRTGTKKPFEETMPPALIEQLVKADAHKESVLQKSYGIGITPAMIEAEVRRIDATTRAPEMLAEIKSALGNDPARFARAMARPIVVERLLREHFENDDQIHLPRRKVVEHLRAELLAAKSKGSTVDQLAALMKKSEPGEFGETSWTLTARPPEAAAESKPVLPPSPTKVNATAGVYSVEATAQVAQVLSSPESNTPGQDERDFYFEDLPSDLQNVLRAQLRQPGDVSAVIETPHGFLLYLATETTPETLSVAAFSLPKLACDEWLSAQNGQPMTKQ